jgi:hypothetical protein
MSLRRLLGINFFIALLLGLACLLLPRQIFGIYGMVLGPPGIWTTRLLGGAFLGFAALMWFGWRSAPPEARRAIAVALLIQNLIALAASVEFQWSDQVGRIGYVNLALFLLLTLGYCAFLFLGPDRQ